MSRLTRDGTAEPVSRDQILRHARGQGNVHFPCSADHEHDWQPYPVDPCSAICGDDTYIHTALANNGRSFFSWDVCMYGHHIIAEYGSTGKGCQSCSWSAEQGKRTFPCPRACLRIWSRETGSAVPSRVSLLISILRLNLVLTYGISPEFRGGVHMKPPYAIGSVPSLSGHAVAYRWRSLPRVRRHGASKPQGSSERVLPWQITMDQLIFASLSHTH